MQGQTKLAPALMWPTYDNYAPDIHSHSSFGTGAPLAACAGPHPPSTPASACQCCGCRHQGVQISSTPEADGAVHGIMSGDKQACVDKLQQEECGNNIQPAGAPAAAIRCISQLDLPAAVVKQDCPRCNQAAGDGNALHIITRGSERVGPQEHNSAT